jgi:hypothetical protein
VSNHAKSTIKAYLAEVFDAGYAMGGEIYNQDPNISDEDFALLAQDKLHNLTVEQSGQAGKKVGKYEEALLAPYMSGMVLGYTSAKGGTFNR